MKVAVKGKFLKENIYYRGVISNYKITGSKIIISVTFNKDVETEYIKSIQIEQNVNSAFVKLAEALEIIDEDGNIDTNDLEGLHVVASLQRGYDDRLYVDRMIVDEKYYSSLEGGEKDTEGK